jgi:hypothetical protein
MYPSAHRQQHDAFDAEQVCCGQFDHSDLVGPFVARGEIDCRFEQALVGDEVLQRREQVRHLDTSCGCAAEEYERVARAMCQLVKATARLARRSHLDRVR